MTDMTWDIEPEFVDLGWTDDFTAGTDWMYVEDDEEDYPYTLEGEDYEQQYLGWWTGGDCE